MDKYTKKINRINRKIQQYNNGISTNQILKEKLLDKKVDAQIEAKKYDEEYFRKKEFLYKIINSDSNIKIAKTELAKNTIRNILAFFLGSALIFLLLDCLTTGRTSYLFDILSSIILSAAPMTSLQIADIKKYKYKVDEIRYLKESNNPDKLKQEMQELLYKESRANEKISILNYHIKTCNEHIEFYRQSIDVLTKSLPIIKNAKLLAMEKIINSQQQNDLLNKMYNVDFVVQNVMKLERKKSDIDG